MSTVDTDGRPVEPFDLAHARAAAVLWQEGRGSADTAASWLMGAVQTIERLSAAPADDAVPKDRDALGEQVRIAWVNWAKQQAAPKPSWLADWDDLDDGQREVDMRIGATVAAMARATAEAIAAGPTLAGVYTRPAVYDVTVWPQDMADDPGHCKDADTWKVTVEIFAFTQAAAITLGWS